MRWQQGLGVVAKSGRDSKVWRRWKSLWRWKGLEVARRSGGLGANRTINSSVPKLMEVSVGHGEVDRSEAYDQPIATKVDENFGGVFGAG